MRSIAVIATVSGRPVMICAEISLGKISVFQLPSDFDCTTHQQIEVEFVMTFQSRRSPFAMSTAEEIWFWGGGLVRRARVRRGRGRVAY